VIIYVWYSGLINSTKPNDFISSRIRLLLAWYLRRKTKYRIGFNLLNNFYLLARPCIPPSSSNSSNPRLNARIECVGAIWT